MTAIDSVAWRMSMAREGGKKEMIGELLGEAAYAIEGLAYEPLGRVG